MGDTEDIDLFFLLIYFRCYDFKDIYFLCQQLRVGGAASDTEDFSLASGQIRIVLLSSLITVMQYL